MDANQALEKFLRRCLSRRADRYVEFANSVKRQSKFLNAIYHELEADLDSSLARGALSEAVLNRPAYLFCPPDTFGVEIPTLREIAASHDDSRLAVARDGSAAVLRPETYVDSVLLFEIS